MATWIIIVEWLARLILVGLIGLSVWSIAIIIDRRRFFKEYENKGQSDGLFELIERRKKQEVLEWARQNAGWRSHLILVILETTNSTDAAKPVDYIARLERLLASLWVRERMLLEKGLSVLGTLGSTTPFVGLLGTILGIIVSFGALSVGQIDSQKIMYSLAEALILTAVGLAVAIPAVVAYNYFAKQLSSIMREADSLKDALIAQFVEGN